MMWASFPPSPLVQSLWMSSLSSPLWVSLQDVEEREDITLNQGTEGKTFLIWAQLSGWGKLAAGGWWVVVGWFLPTGCFCSEKTAKQPPLANLWLRETPTTAAVSWPLKATLFLGISLKTNLSFDVAFCLPTSSSFGDAVGSWQRPHRLYFAFYL